jgi:hypothetical protein
VICSKCSGRAASLLVLLPMLLGAQRAQEKVVPLKNWSTPLYWHPNQGESAASSKPLGAAPSAPVPTFLTFVAITPCRLVDTRGVAGNFNGIEPFVGPSIPGGTTVTFPVQSLTEAGANNSPAPCGVIPSIAEAYSFNLTVIPQGGGSVGYVTLWPAGEVQPFVATLNDSQGLIVNNAAIVPAGVASLVNAGGSVSLYNSGPAIIDVVIDMNGYFAEPTDLNGNTAIGTGTLESNNGGTYNTATGADALQDNTTGSYNTAGGWAALTGNTTGSGNTASGFAALAFNTTGQNNTAVGYDALQYAYGGSGNTVVGTGALQYITTGNNNIALGINAGYNASGTASNNIYIGSPGYNTDNGSIQIGIPGTQTSFFVGGVGGVTTGVADAVPVVIDSHGQLGTMSSSQRFKEDIQDMGDASSGLLRLRPVTFRYVQAYQDGSKPLDYGLIAEEVAEVYPDLVVKGQDGKIQTVQYQKLTPMLLNELQKQADQIRSLEDRLAALEAGSLKHPPADAKINQ